MDLFSKNRSCWTRVQQKSMTLAWVSWSSINRFDGMFSFFLVLWYLCSTHWRKHSNTCQTNDYIYSHQWTNYFDVNETKTHSQCRTEIFDRPDLIELSKYATDLGTTAMSRLSRDLHRWFHPIVAQWTCLPRYPASTQVYERHGWISISLLFCSPQAINIKDAYRKSNRENLIRAFDFAQKQYGIAQLIDPEGKMPLLTGNVLKTLFFSRCGHGWTWWEKYFTLCCPSLQSMSDRSQPSISTWTRSSELHRSFFFLFIHAEDRLLWSRFIWRLNCPMNTLISPLICCNGWKSNSTFSTVKGNSRPSMISKAISMFWKPFDRMKCADSRVCSIECDRSMRKPR